MSPIALLWTLAAGSFLTMAVLDLLVAALRRMPRVHVAFSLVALAAMGGTLVELSSFGATSVTAMTVSIKWGVALNILAHLFLITFMVQYADVRLRWPGWLAAGVFGLAGVVHLALPAGITFRRIESIAMVTLPWGESIALPEGPVHPLWPLSLASIPILLLFLGDLVVQTRRRGDARRAWRIAATGTILFAAFVEGFLADALILHLPGLSTVSFLGILALTGEDLVRGVVRAAELNREVTMRDRRWQDVTANVQLAMVGIGPDGRVEFVNPYFARLVGADASAFVGKEATALVAPEQAADIRARIDAVVRGDAPPHAEWAVRTASGAERLLAWSTVRLLDVDGTPTGLLSIGADVSDRVSAQDELRNALVEVTQLREQLERENVYLREELRADLGMDEIVGKSDAILYVLHKIEQVAGSDATVLLEGETGVGKELVAHAIHDRSPRRERPLIRVNCAAITATLFESELFGHERGAFTGADRRRRGFFELADGGTLFLDEITELPLELQPKLLRVLQEGELQRVGAEATTAVDVRVIAATNAELTEDIKAGRFREDLYFRLSTFPITVPPLRDRREDIPLLVQHFVAQYAKKRRRTITEIAPGALDELVAYDWPGNVRELQNVIERAVLTATGPVLRLAESLPATGRGRNGIRRGGDRVETLEDVERAHILTVLHSTDWRIAGPGGAAERLGINASTLRSRMKKLDVSRPGASTA